MSNFDPIPRLQQIAATIEESGADIFDAPATAAYYIECAIKEIERLNDKVSFVCGDLALQEIDRLRSRLRSEIDRITTERDEARRIACKMEERAGCDESGCPKNGEAEEIATRRGWDCFKENTNG